MTASQENEWGGRLIGIARGSSLFAILLSCIVLVGWVLHIEILTRFHPQIRSMKVLVAICFIALAIAILSLSADAISRLSRRAVQAACIAVCLVGAYSLLEYVIVGIPSIDQIFVNDFTVPASHPWPGRMAPPVAINFILLGMSLLILDVRGCVICCELLALLALAIGLLSGIAYAYSVPLLYGPRNYTQMTAHVAVLFILLSLAVLFIRNDRGVTSVISSNTAGGVLSRRLLPAVVIVPFVVGWLRLNAQRRGLLGTEAGVAMLVSVLILIFGTLIWWTAYQLKKADLARLQAASALSQSQVMFDTLFDSAADPVIAVNQDGHIVRISRQGEHIFGYRRDQIMGQHVEVLLPERFRGGHVSFRNIYLKSPRPRAMGAGRELYARRSDGTEFPVEISLTPIETTDGLLILSTISDITERKVAEQALRDGAEDLARSNKDLEQFAYVASHDLQEPLRAVAGCVQLLQQRYADKMDTRADELIQHAVDGATRMQTLLGDLLAYSRVGTRSKSSEPADCNMILQRAIANLEVSIKESEAEIVNEGLPTVAVDVSQMTQVFQNLIANAVKFKAGRNPVIHIGARQSGGQWTFHVRDNGIGIEPQYAERIFGVFQRLHTRREYPGTGIGLAICKKTIERHGGKIWVESEPGNGSTFYFTISQQS